MRSAADAERANPDKISTDNFRQHFMNTINLRQEAAKRSQMKGFVGYRGVPGANDPAHRTGGIFTDLVKLRDYSMIQSELFWTLPCVIGTNLMTLRPAAV